MFRRIKRHERLTALDATFQFHGDLPYDPVAKAWDGILHFQDQHDSDNLSLDHPVAWRNFQRKQHPVHR